MGLNPGKNEERKIVSEGIRKKRETSCGRNGAHAPIDKTIIE
jgi:hypothetical protein